MIKIVIVTFFFSGWRKTAIIVNLQGKINLFKQNHRSTSNFPEKKNQWSFLIGLEFSWRAAPLPCSFNEAHSNMTQTEYGENKRKSFEQCTKSVC